MGAESDELAVVDTELKVRGSEALRVVDASVMPDLVERQHQRGGVDDCGEGRGIDPRHADRPQRVMNGRRQRSPRGNRRRGGRDGRARFDSRATRGPRGDRDSRGRGDIRICNGSRRCTRAAGTRSVSSRRRTGW